MLGLAQRATKYLHCGTCVMRNSCRDKRKSRKFACTLHTVLDDADPSSAHWKKYLNELARSESVVVDKFQIDDSDAPLAPNFYKWCLSGDTLVPTEKGLLRIDEIASEKSQNLDLRVLGAKGVAKATQWLFQGKKKLNELVLETGHTLKATKDHQILTLSSSGELEWKELQELRKGDLVCVSQHKLSRNKSLPLNLTKPVYNTCANYIRTPKFMNPNIAFFLGVYGAEGSMSKFGIAIKNNDSRLLEALKIKVESEFGIQGSLKYPGKKRRLAKVINTYCYILPTGMIGWNSVNLSRWFKELGIHNERTPLKRQAYFKTVPWSILQADKNSQLAYIAGFIEGDGWISPNCKRIGIMSVSRQLLAQMQALLQSLGFHAYILNRGRIYQLQTNGATAKALYSALSPYLISKHPKEIIPAFDLSDSIPNIAIAALKSRFVSKTYGSTKFKCDDGKEIEVRCWQGISKNFMRSNSLPRISLRSGFYDDTLNPLKKISPKVYANLKHLDKSNYRFIPVKQINKLPGLHSTYDLSIDSNFDPAFVANGIVVHNCIGKKYLKAQPTPFPKQLQLGLKLFNDMCPKCSDPDWYDEIPFDADVREIPERVQLYKYGRCPKCGTTRLECNDAGLSHDYEDLVVVAGQRCVTGDTLVTTSQGLIRISDFAQHAKLGWNTGPFRKRNLKLRTNFALTNSTGSSLETTKLYVAPKERVYTLVTREGISIRGTHEHPIMTKYGFKKLSQISPSTILPIHYNQNVWSSNNIISLDLARLMGFWVSEGSGSKRTIHVTNYDHDVLDLCAKEMQRLATDVVITMRDRENVDPSLGLKRCVGTTNKTAYRRFSKLVDGAYRKSAEKLIPRSILESNKDIVCAFLQAMFEGDGGVGKKAVGYASISYTLIKQLQTVLLNLGIPTKMRKRMSWATNGSINQVSKPYWGLIIKGETAVCNFAKHIGFFSARKQNALNDLVKYWKNRRNEVPVWYDVYPNEVKQEFIQLIASADTELQKFRPTSDTKRGFMALGNVSMRTLIGDYRRILASNVCLSRQRLSKYAHFMKTHPRWKDLSIDVRLAFLKFFEIYLDKNIYWTTVKSVTLSKKKYTTYDFYVPKHHCFMANGLLNHNSGKCVIGTTTVNTTRGYIQIKDCVAGDTVLLQGKQHKVLRHFVRGKKIVVSKRTELGYAIVGTPDHKIKTIFGWENLSKAKYAILDLTPTIWSTRNSTSLVVPDSVLDLLTSLSKEKMIRQIKGNILAESYYNNDLSIKLSSLEYATATHTLLLGFGILSKRDRQVLSILHPYVRKYIREIGIKDRNVAFTAWLSPKVEPKVSGSVCNILYQATQMLIMADMLVHTKDSLLYLELQQNLASHNFTHVDLHRLGKVLNRLTFKDKFLLHMVQTIVAKLVKKQVYLDTFVSTRWPVKKERVYDIEVEDAHAFVGNGMYVHNSTSMGLIVSYHMHQLLKLKDVSRFYNLKQGQILYGHLVGIRYSDAKTNVWDPIVSSIEDSPWFSLYHSILGAAAAKRGEEEYFRFKDTYAYYRGSGLYISPASPSRRSLRGKTRFMFTIDELAHFSSDEKLVNISGLEVWRALSRSAQTVRLEHYKLRKKRVINVPTAIGVAISSPYEVTDPIMQLYNKPTKKQYSVLYPTWEFNPDMTYEFLEPEFERNPESAWRDFGCRPPYSAASFVSDIKLFGSVINKQMSAAYRQQTIVLNRGTRKAMLGLKLKRRWADTQIKKLMAIDAGATLNAFAVAVVHLDSNNRVIYDVLLELTPKAKIPISFTAMYDAVILPIAKEMNVGVLTSDRWQNKKIMSDLERDVPSLMTIEHKLKYSELVSWREALINGDFYMPRPELKAKEILYPENDSTFIDKPVASYIYESLRVVDIPGKRVDKPTEGNDDMFRAAALAHAVIRIPEVATILKKGDLKKRSSGRVATISTVANHNNISTSRVAVTGRFSSISNRAASSVAVTTNMR